MARLTPSLLRELLARAATAPRRRAHHLLHSGDADPVQRFIVAGTGDSYFRPHRHLTKSELAVCVHGRIDVLAFDDAGRVVERHAYGDAQDGFGWETAAGTWHTLVPLGPFAFVEVKQGPYDPATSVEYAAWAPAEGDAAAAAFRARLLVAQPGDLLAG